MKHGLLGREPGNGRQHAEGVGGQEHNILGMSRQPRDHGVIDKIHGIGRAGVFRFAAVVVVRDACALGVAAAFKVENSISAPAVFVVANQQARGIRRKRGLAGSGKTEEKGGVARFADVGRAVHGKHVLLRQ